MTTLPNKKRVVVVAALIIHEGRALLSQRRSDQSFPNCWEFPGGKMEAGESPDVALAREIREELDCEVRVGRIYEALFHSYSDFDLLMLVYRCQIISGEPNPVEVAAVNWVPIKDIIDLELPKADYPLARRLAKEYCDGKS